MHVDLVGSSTRAFDPFITDPPPLLPLPKQVMVAAAMNALTVLR
jgi:hypothetical protein